MAFEEKGEGVRQSSCEKRDNVGEMRKREREERAERVERKMKKGKEQPERLTKIEMTLP